MARRTISKLIVVFLCAKYQEKEWCGVEFNVIREFILKKQVGRIMYIKMDDRNVEGALKTDGFIDGRIHNPQAVAELIKLRIDSLDLK